MQKFTAVKKAFILCSLSSQCPTPPVCQGNKSIPPFLHLLISLKRFSLKCIFHSSDGEEEDGDGLAYIHGFLFSPVLFFLICKMCIKALSLEKFIFYFFKQNLAQVDYGCVTKWKAFRTKQSGGCHGGGGGGEVWRV